MRRLPWVAVLALASTALAAEIEVAKRTDYEYRIDRDDLGERFYLGDEAFLENKDSSTHDVTGTETYQQYQQATLAQTTLYAEKHPPAKLAPPTFDEIASAERTLRVFQGRAKPTAFKKKYTADYGCMTPIPASTKVKVYGFAVFTQETFENCRRGLPKGPHVLDADHPERYFSPRNIRLYRVKILEGYLEGRFFWVANNHMFKARVVK